MFWGHYSKICVHNKAVKTGNWGVGGKQQQISLRSMTSLRPYHHECTQSRLSQKLSSQARLELVWEKHDYKHWHDGDIKTENWNPCVNMA